MLHRILLSVLIPAISTGYLSLAMAQDYDGPVSQSSTINDTGASGMPFSPLLRAKVQSHQFQNKALEINGYSTNMGLSIYQPYLYEFYIYQPFINGYSYKEEVSELGNLHLGAEFRAFDIMLQRPTQVWIQLDAKLAAEIDARFAAKYDSYRFGAELNQKLGSVTLAFGSGYQFRINELNRNIDIGNIIDTNFSLSWDFSHYWGIFAKTLFYHVEPINHKDLEITNSVRWAAIRPGLKLRLVRGFDVTGSVTLPFFQSEDAEHVEVAFSDIDYPRASKATWNLSFGASF